MSNLLELLEGAGVDVHYGSREDEINICCPFCVDRGESADHRYRLGINVTTGAAQCFNCHWKGRGEFTRQCVCRVFGIPYKRSANALKPTLPIKVREKRVKKVKLSLPEEYEAFGPSDDLVAKEARSYLSRRGISVMQIVKHKIGFAAVGTLAWRVVFPIIDNDGKVHGCAARAIRTSMQPKYLNTPGIKILWNAMDTARTAVVVEGIIDGLKVEQALLRERDMIAVARLGSAITKNQMDQLKQYERVIVFPDRDRAGLHGATELCNRCTARGITTAIVLPQTLDGRDPGNMTEQEIIDGIRSALPWRKSTEWRLRLICSKGVSSGLTETSVTA